MNPSLAPPPQVIWFRGGDAVKFLNDLISQEIALLEPGSVVQSLLLDPQGKLDFLLWVVRGEDEVALVTEDGRGEELATRLKRYRIRVDVEIESETRTVYLVVGGTDDSRGRFEADGGVIRADLSWPSLVRTLQIGDPAPELPAVDPQRLAAIRIGDGIPIVGIDLDEKTIPQEASVVAETVSFNKGCFLGQELVARLDSRGGRVNRHLRILEAESPLTAGTLLMSGTKEVGIATSVAGTIGLALVWREVEPGDVVDADGTRVTIRDVPQKTAGSFTTS
jgi:tRNA-modifying protein YgfZ